MIPRRKQLQKYFDDNKLAIQYIYQKNIVPFITSCPEDGYSMHQITDFRFKCRKKNHRKIYTALSNSVLKHVKLEICDFLNLIYLWICEVPIKSILLMTGHSSETVGRIFKMLRHYINLDIELNDTKIGGQGIIVQLDECKFGKRKYHRGHRVDGVWVFGGIEVTEERKMFAVVVERRDGITLNQLILKYVLPGSIVITDGWKGYNEFKNNPNFQHKWVNHSITFKNDKGYHTNNIEGTWNGMKIKIKPQSRVKRRMQGYLFEFMWRRKNKKNLWSGLLYALRY